jgi:hypothetical protein
MDLILEPICCTICTACFHLSFYPEVRTYVYGVGMHVDLCFASGCMHVLRHGVLMLLGILKVFQI